MLTLWEVWWHLYYISRSFMALSFPHKISIIFTTGKCHLSQCKVGWPQYFTSFGHPKIEKGKMPDENQVSRTSSSETQEQKLSHLDEYGGDFIKLGGPLHWHDLNQLDNLYSNCNEISKLKSLPSYPVWGLFCQQSHWSVLLPSLWPPPRISHSPSNDHPCPTGGVGVEGKQSE